MIVGARLYNEVAPRTGTDLAGAKLEVRLLIVLYQAAKGSVGAVTLSNEGREKRAAREFQATATVARALSRRFGLAVTLAAR